MKKLFLPLALVLVAWGGMQLWAKPARSTQLAGRHWVTWETARQQNQKPILLVQMLGDLDQRWC